MDLQRADRLYGLVNGSRVAQTHALSVLPARRCRISLTLFPQVRDDGGVLGG
jgi:hypothetical protein